MSSKRTIHGMRFRIGESLKDDVDTLQPGSVAGKRRRQSSLTIRDFVTLRPCDLYS